MIYLGMLDRFRRFACEQGADETNHPKAKDTESLRGFADTVWDRCNAQLGVVRGPHSLEGQKGLVFVGCRTIGLGLGVLRLRA